MRHGDSSAKNTSTCPRQVYFDGDWHDTPVYDGDRLGPDVRIDGPAIVEYPHSGTVLPPRTSAVVDKRDNLIITVDLGTPVIS